jgi:hypothetical protein
VLRGDLIERHPEIAQLTNVIRENTPTLRFACMPEIIDSPVPGESRAATPAWERQPKPHEGRPPAGGRPSSRSVAVAVAAAVVVHASAAVD